MSNDVGNQEIIIVRRSKGDDHGHHGGAWKIAFADFMTAMMALFLVLWLVNAANEDAKKSIASYFNPIKLADRQKAPRGVQPPENNSEAKRNEDARESRGVPEPEQSNEGGLTETPITDETFFADPEKALDAIAASAVAPDDARGAAAEAIFASNEVAPSTDDIQPPEFIDPFSPVYWNSVQLSEQESEDLQALDPAAPPVSSDDDTTSAFEFTDITETEADGTAEFAEDPDIIDPDSESAIPPLPSLEDVLQEPERPATIESELAEAMGSDAPGEEEEIAAAEEGAETIAENGEEQPSSAEQLAGELTEELSEAFEIVGISIDQLSIDAQSDGVLISLADNLDFSMFGIGSAVPSKELVDAVAILGDTLAQRNTKVEIVGHTDGRPFQNANRDNWQLSSARAQAALYMLVRGGVPEDRIVSISGRADRDLKNPDDPFAAENRRIDILVRLDET